MTRNMLADNKRSQLRVYMLYILNTNNIIKSAVTQWKHSLFPQYKQKKKSAFMGISIRQNLARVA